MRVRSSGSVAAISACVAPKEKPTTPARSRDVRSRSSGSAPRIDFRAAATSMRRALPRGHLRDQHRPTRRGERTSETEQGGVPPTADGEPVQHHPRLVGGAVRGEEQRRGGRLPGHLDLHLLLVSRRVGAIRAQIAERADPAHASAPITASSDVHPSRRSSRSRPVLMRRTVPGPPVHEAGVELHQAGARPQHRVRVKRVEHAAHADDWQPPLRSAIHAPHPAPGRAGAGEHR